MKNLVHEWSKEAIIVIRLDHPQCPNLGQLWIQAEPSESQGRIISKKCFIKRPFIDFKCKLHNKLNLFNFKTSDQKPPLNSKTILCAHTPTPPPQYGKTFHRLWEEFVHSINSSTLQMGILLFDKDLRSQYGNTGNGVSSRGIQNYKGFSLKLNIHKEHYWILRIGIVGRCQKSQNLTFKVHFLCQKSSGYFSLNSLKNINLGAHF